MWNRTSTTKGSAAEDQTDFDAAEILDQLETYKLRDPDYKAAIENFAMAEAEHADPLEGKPYIVKATQSMVPVEHKKRRSLNARVG